MDASYLSFLCTNDFRCVIRYYYGVNANTDEGSGRHRVENCSSKPYYSKTCLKRPLKKDQNPLSLNAGQKYFDTLDLH